jgi:predicted  nucleic acid-binding Zn-ribbon protein
MKSNSKSESISHNLQKLKKYQQRANGSNGADSGKRSIYNQKIQFYKQNLHGAGMTSETINGSSGMGARTRSNNSADTDVNALLSKIDSMIQRSKSTRASVGSMKGGSKKNGSKISGHRIMTNGMRGIEGLKNMRGGAPGDDDDGGEGSSTRPGAGPDNEMDILNQARALLEVPMGSELDLLEQEKTIVINALNTHAPAIETRNLTIEKLMAQIKTLDDKIRELETAAATAGTEGSVAQAELARLKGQIAALEEAKTKLDDEILALRNLIKTLDDKLVSANVSASAPPNEDVIAMRDRITRELETLIAERDTLKQAKVDATAAATGAAGVADEAKKREADLNKEKQDLITLIKQLNARIKGLRDRLDFSNERFKEIQASVGVTDLAIQDTKPDVTAEIERRVVGPATGGSFTLMGGDMEKFDKLIQKSIVDISKITL